MLNTAVEAGVPAVHSRVYRTNDHRHEGGISEHIEFSRITIKGAILESSLTALEGSSFFYPL